MSQLKSVFQKWDFRRQLAVAVIAGVLVLAIVTSLAVSKTTTDSVRKKLYEQGAQVTQTLSSQSAFALASSSPQLASEAFELALGFHNVQAAAIYDKQGKSVYAKDESDLLLSYKFNGSITDVQLWSEDEQSWHFVAPVFSEDTSMADLSLDDEGPQLMLEGYVAVVISKSVLNEIFRDTFRNNTLVSLSVAVLLLFALLALASRITKPLEQLSRIMSRAEEGEKMLRSDISGPKDIADMQNAFNTMMAVLERRELELLQAKDAALESARVKGEFAANVSHELRTPMNAILGMLDLLMTMGLTPKQSEYVDTAKSAGEVLLELIDDVLNFSKVESSAVLLKKEDVFVEDLLDEVIGLLTSNAMKREVELGYVCATDVPQLVSIDAARIRQVLINLVGNAIKFTYQGEVAVRLNVEHGQLDGQTLLRFEVRDSGIGIAPEAQEWIFDAFTQADSSTTREYGGTGLGLAISRRIVELLGGEISLDSTLGEGSIFWFTVPLTEQDIITKPEQNSKPPEEFQQLQVLSVDSSDIVHDFLCSRFEAWKINHVALKNGLDGLSLLRSRAASDQPFQLVILDEEIAGLKGIDFIKLLLDEPLARDTKVVVLVSPWSEYEKLYPKQVIRFSKPLRTGVLFDALRQVVGKDADQAGSAEKTRQLPFNQLGKRVLVADDNRANQQVAVGMLEQLGCEVSVAETGEQAMNMVLRHSLDLVLMDCQMPVMDGYEATSRIRKLEGGRSNVPIVAMTANNSTEEEQRCREAGMDDFLPKPLRFNELQKKLLLWFGDEAQKAKADVIDEPSQIADPMTVSKGTFDMEVMDELRSSVGEVVDSMIEAFLEDTPVYLQSLKHAVADEDAKQTRELAHTVKGSAANFGAYKVVTLSKELEEAARQGNLDGAQEKVAVLIKAFRALSKDLQQQISGDKSPHENQGKAAASYNVLIADDDRSMRMALRNALEADDYSIEEAQNGTHAVAICRRKMPDLILIDAVMPEVDGFNACEQIRELPNGVDIPILMITALDDENSIVRAFSAGASDYIPKPIHFSVMRQRVSRLLQASKAEQHVKKLAYHDPLTGLPNRASLMQQLRLMINRASLNNEMVAVLFLDLDRFKMINDSLGHDAGDLLLKAVADRIRRCLREQDFVARLGGDEFTVVLEGIHSPNVAATVAQKICDSLSEPFVFLQQKMFVTTSIGISLSPADGEDMGALIKHADSAMFSAKEKGNSYRFYEQGMEDEVYRRLEMERELRHALEEDELVLYYQPKLDAKTGAVVSAEALVRWQHPKHGLLMPDKFIPLAEESDLIAELGQWVLRAACRQVSTWAELGFRLRVAVNVSGAEIQAEDLVERLTRTLDECKVPPELLELEITESMLLEEHDRIIEALNQIKKTGVTLAIDDFGSGYSSLNYLKHLPVDTLKIDRLFINDLDGDEAGQAIVAGIIALADNLGLETVAEGVETERQQQLLKELGCTLLQGFLFSKAIPADNFAKQYLHSTTGEVVH